MIQSFVLTCLQHPSLLFFSNKHIIFSNWRYEIITIKQIKYIKCCVIISFIWLRLLAYICLSNNSHLQLHFKLQIWCTSQEECHNTCCAKLTETNRRKTLYCVLFLFYYFVIGLPYRNTLLYNIRILFSTSLWLHDFFQMLHLDEFIRNKTENVNDE